MEEKNIFMVCNQLNQAAMSHLPERYFFRNCKKEELSLWKRMHFDTEEMADQYSTIMDTYYKEWYAEKENLFYETCLFVCNNENKPIGTGFIWKQYGIYSTVHWIKVRQEYENQGIGRALISKILQGVAVKDFPIYLHTQPSSYRAIKLYSDFGFALISNPTTIDGRKNESIECMKLLKESMPPAIFEQLKIVDCSCQ